MREDQVQEIQEMIDTVFARLKLDIKNAPAEALPHITKSLLMFKDFSNAMQNNDINQSQQASMMRALRKQIENGNFGIDWGNMPPGFTPPPPPNQPQQ